MAYNIKNTALPGWKRWLMALVGLTVTGCAALDPCCKPQTSYYAIPTFPAPSRNVALQACAEHAAASMKSRLPDDFKMMRLDADNSLLQSRARLAVGDEPISQVIDGRGIAYFKKESRVVTFHCLTDGSNTPLYTFLRPE